MDDQDSVFRNETYQRDETDLRINVERRCPAVGKKFAERHFQESKKKSAENGEWNRAKQNNEGIAEAARIRLRPIMMTSVATVAGHFPLTLVSGAGAAARNSIGLVLVGGMTIGTIFTLFIVPSLYMLIAKEHHEKSLMDVGWEDAPEDVDLTPEFEPALAPDGNGNDWKQG